MLEGKEGECWPQCKISTVQKAICRRSVERLTRFTHSRLALGIPPSNSLLDFFLGEDLDGVVGKDIAQAGPEGGAGDQVPRPLAGGQKEKKKEKETNS